MIRRIVIMLAALMPIVSQAQLAVGGWTMHSPFAGVDDIMETGTYTYYLSGNSLFRIDKETMEVGALNVSNLLNDSNITGIYESDDRKSVIVAYESGNMDRLYDDGSILNLSDIKDASITGSRVINDIAFGKDNFYVAADFGLVTYDKKKNEVKESAFTDLKVTNVVAMGNIVGIHYDQQMHFAPQSEKITSLAKIPVLSGFQNKFTCYDMQGYGDNKVLLTQNNECYLITVDMANDKADMRRDIYKGAFITKPNKLVKGTKDGIYVWNVSGLYKFPNEGDIEFISLPNASALTDAVCYNGDMSSLWIGNSNGIRMMDYSNPSSPAVVHDAIKGSDLTVPYIHAMHIGPSGKIYLYNLGEQQTFKLPTESRNRSFVNVLQNGEIRDISGVDVQIQNKNGYSKTAPYYVNYNIRLFEDPTEDDAYYIGSFFEGMYRIKDGKQTHKFYENNSPIIYNGYACLAMQPLIDKNDNLWVFSWKGTDDSSFIFVLPSEKRHKENVAKSDWKTIKVSEWEKERRDAIGLVCRQSDYVIFAEGRYAKQFFIADTKGTADLSDDEYKVVNTFIDQDGKQLTYNNTTAIAEDLDGRIWVGTDDGVFEITDLSKVTAGTTKVNHLKVSRNDGTNLADYLLASQMVSGIAVDSANRKWITTIGSGAYLVNENGDEILEHYTSSNSILPNTVFSVACDPTSNKVYFGTGIGLIEYSSTSSPGSEDYSNVYAYPNPVRPDFGGWITVTGLMENSLVKIADAAGNVFYQGRSDGGMFTWDGCNAAGERVKTGVYYVYASQNATGSNEACVTKIMVIN